MVELMLGDACWAMCASSNAFGQAHDALPATLAGTSSLPGASS